ncbi:MAG: hypothetical protein ACERKZ_13975 [Lachnotalea sp.]
MKYLFIDVEGHQEYNQFSVAEADILEIAAICVNKNFNKEQFFLSKVSPTHCYEGNDTTQSNFILDSRTIEAELPVAALMEKFGKIVPAFPIIIVWNRCTYHLFLKIASQYGIKLPKNKVVVLQELLSMNQPVFENLIGFENAIKRYHVKFDPKLFYSARHNVECLKQLYCSVKFQYKYQCKVKPISKVALIEDPIVTHSSNCHYIVDKNLIQKVKETDAFMGHQRCKHFLNKNLNKQGRIDRLLTMLEKERREKEIENESFLQETSK